jgi:hypothetical protein
MKSADEEETRGEQQNGRRLGCGYRVERHLSDRDAAEGSQLAVDIEAHAAAHAVDEVVDVGGEGIAQIASRILRIGKATDPRGDGEMRGRTQ